jgi:hypothetical protein
MTFTLVVSALATAFLLGKSYGAAVEKEAVAVSVAAFAKAKTILAGVIKRAQANAKAEAERLEELAAKYL